MLRSARDKEVHAFSLAGLLSLRGVECAVCLNFEHGIAAAFGVHVAIDLCVLPFICVDGVHARRGAWKCLLKFQARDRASATRAGAHVATVASACEAAFGVRACGIGAAIVGAIFAFVDVAAYRAVAVDIFITCGAVACVATRCVDACGKCVTTQGASIGALVVVDTRAVLLHVTVDADAHVCGGGCGNTLGVGAAGDSLTRISRRTSCASCGCVLAIT